MKQSIIDSKNLGIAALTGIATGIIISTFRLGIPYIARLSHNLLMESEHQILFGFLFIGLMLLLAMIANGALYRESFISGSGIPQVSGQIQNKLELKWYRVLFYKFLGGLAAIGSGLTLGREGPSVQIGAAIGQGMATISKSSKEQSKFLIAGAAGGGMAAAFNAPLSGIIFVYEELFHKSSRTSFIYTALTIILASLTSNFILGSHPSLTVPVYHGIETPSPIWSIILGILLGGSGVLFNASILKANKIYTQMQIPKWAKHFLPFLVTAIILLKEPQFFGSGENMILLPLIENPSIQILCFFLLIKWFLLLLAFGSGLPGGIFFPLLALGALLGNIYGSLLFEFGLINHDAILYFIILAMSSHFAAIVRAPLTGIILIIEMTGSPLPWLLPIAIASYTAVITAEFLGCDPIYESLLDIILAKKGNR